MISAAPESLIERASKIEQAFTARFGRTPQIAFAPGRVNLLGDHIDYCGGTVLPLPIEQGTLVAAARNAGGVVNGISDNQTEEILFDAQQSASYGRGHWGRFLVGCHNIVRERAPDLRGVDLMISGNIPSGGLSSSASLSVSLLLAMYALAGVKCTAMEIALAAQRVEHEYIGVNCGLMDQAAITLGTPDAAVLFDCASQTAQQILIQQNDIAIVVADSGVPRQLADSAYNERRQSLAKIAAEFGIPEHRLAPGLPADPTLQDETLRARARHVYTEHNRVLAAVTAVAAEDWRKLGSLLSASHTSLAGDYQVSCRELDTLVAAFDKQAGCYGARMTGAGFGGAIVAVIERAQQNACTQGAVEQYHQATGLTANTFVARSIGGAHVLG